jgi:hypothetical protein
MTLWHSYFATRKMITLIGVASLLFVCVYGYVEGPQAATAKHNFPVKGKMRLAKAPDNALFGMIYINTKNNQEYIFDGSEWVPHDASVEDYYLQRDAARSLKTNATMQTQADATGIGVQPESLQAGEILPAGNCGTGTGGHEKHGAFNCKTCHYVGGVLCFDINGPAVAPGNVLPSFDTASQSCSNIACHGMYSGTFSYYFPGGDGEPELKTVLYAGSGGSTPSWYATGLGCAACHGNPPPNGVWHSGYHAGGPTAASNQCQFCHPDASGSNGMGTTVTNAVLHSNGTVNVQARFTSSCFGCH